MKINKGLVRRMWKWDVVQVGARYVVQIYERKCFNWFCWYLHPMQFIIDVRIRFHIIHQSTRSIHAMDVGNLKSKKVYIN